MDYEEKKEEQIKKNTPKENVIGCLTLIVLAAIIILIVRGCWGGKDSDNKEVVEVAKQAAGLGVTRDRIVSSLAEKGYGFSGEEGLTDGQPHWAGETDGGLATLDLIGDKDNLTRVGLIFAVPEKNTDKAANGIIYMCLILDNIFPQWDERKEWIISALDQVIKEGKDEVKTNIDGKNITFLALKDAGIYCLDVDSTSK